MNEKPECVEPKRLMEMRKDTLDHAPEGTSKETIEYLKQRYEEAKRKYEECQEKG